LYEPPCCCVNVPLSEKLAPAAPPPPPMLCAMMPWACSPDVVMSPVWLTVTLPPLLPEPPSPPAETLSEIDLPLEAFHPPPAAIAVPPVPPPPPTLIARMP